MGQFFWNIFPSLLLAAISLVIYLYPPKKINHMYGYRTRRSMASQEKWDFANRLNLKLFWWITLILFLLGCAVHYTMTFGVAQMTLYLAMVVLLVLIIPITERALKKEFEDE